MHEIMVLAWLAGCGTSVMETPVNPAPRPLTERPPESVEVFTSGAPERPHVDVMLLEAEQTSNFSVDNTPDFIAELRARAAKIGCDAIVVGGITNATVPSIDMHTSTSRKGLTASCIVYKPPG